MYTKLGHFINPKMLEKAKKIFFSLKMVAFHNFRTPNFYGKTHSI